LPLFCLPAFLVSPFLIACSFIIRTYLIHYFYSVCNKSNTKVGTCGVGTAYPSVGPEFAPFFLFFLVGFVLLCCPYVFLVLYDFPIKRCSIRLDLLLVLCFVNVI
jgi:hypothetical protein